MQESAKVGHRRARGGVSRAIRGGRRMHGVQSRLAGGAWAIRRLVQVPLLNPAAGFTQNSLPICGHLQPSYDPRGWFSDH